MLSNQQASKDTLTLIAELHINHYCCRILEDRKCNEKTKNKGNMGGVRGPAVDGLKVRLNLDLSVRTRGH